MTNPRTKSLTSAIPQTSMTPMMRKVIAALLTLIVLGGCTVERKPTADVDFLLAQVHRSLDRTVDTWEEFSQGSLTLDATAEVLETERILLVSIAESNDLPLYVRSKAKDHLYAMTPFLETLKELDIKAGGDGSVRLGP